MAVHDQRIKYLDQLNGLVRTPTTKGSILGMKAHDMIVFSGKNLDVNSAYSIEKEAVDLEKENADYFMFQDMMDLSLRKLKADTNHKENFIHDYLAVSGYADAAYKATKSEKTKKLLKTAKDNVDAYFINSGTATCEDMQSIYGPRLHRINQIWII